MSAEYSNSFLTNRKLTLLLKACPPICGQLWLLDWCNTRKFKPWFLTFSHEVPYTKSCQHNPDVLKCSSMPSSIIFMNLHFKFSSNEYWGKVCSSDMTGELGCSSFNNLSSKQYWWILNTYVPITVHSYILTKLNSFQVN